MDHYNWLAHWEQDHLPFHLSTTNPLLAQHWSKLNIATPSNVLVPLCGKTNDLLWLATQGHHVIGVELSEIACKAFFNENGLSFSKSTRESFIRYDSKQITLYCGDLFNLSVDLLPPISAIYDRAALIALPDDLRRRYVNHLTQLITPASQVLLIIFESSDKVQGPPYPISPAEVKRLFNDHFKIQELARIKITDIPKHLQGKGYSALDEVVYGLIKE